MVTIMLPDDPALALALLQRKQTEIIRDLVGASGREAVTKKIIERTCAAHGVTVQAVKSGRMAHHLVMARANICWSLRQEQLPFAEIGASLGMTKVFALRGVRRWQDFLDNKGRRPSPKEG